MAGTDPNPTEEPSPFRWVDGEPWYRGLRVRVREFRLGGESLRIASLADAAALLDDPEMIQEFERTDRLPYGLELWPSAVMLAEQILAGETGTDRSAIELGCGVGLVSIAAALRGWQIEATDVDPAALAFAEHNARASTAPVRRFRLLDWHEHSPTGPFDRVFAADVLYQRTDHQPLLERIGQLLSTNGIAYVADPCRGVADRFDDLARSAGFNVQTVRASASTDEGKPVEGRIFVLERDA